MFATYTNGSGVAFAIVMVGCLILSVGRNELIHRMEVRKQRRITKQYLEFFHASTIKALEISPVQDKGSICPNCGHWTYDMGTFCSEGCSISYIPDPEFDKHMI